MAYPGILRRLFQHDGAGPLLRPEIVPLGMPKGLVAPFYRVYFGGADGRRPIFWGQTVVDEGWVLADGGSDGAGGTVPDLRDRMIMGAGAAYTAGSTGGSVTHGHNVSGSVGSTTLSTSQMPSHGHSVNTWRYAGNVQADRFGSDFTNQHVGTAYTNAAGGSSAHLHSLDASVSAVNSLPPYYALAYLIKL